MAKAKKAPAVKKGPRPQRLPGMEDAKIEGLHALALDYAEMRDQRQALTTQEVALKQKVLAKMHEHGKTTYTFQGVHITIKPENEKVIVRIAKSEKDDEAEG